MAQLSDDCFAFGGALMSVKEALRLMAGQVPVVAETERVTLAEAAGRILIDDLVAGVPLPPFDNSAVDGFAVRFADLAPGRDNRFPIAGYRTAGKPEAARLEAGRAVRIFTGAVMPEGADTVFMQEDCEVEDGHVVLPPGLALGANRRLAGEDIARGAIALPKGQRLRPADVALAAAVGVAKLEVRRRLRVAVFSTGDEIVEPGTPLRPAGLYDSNRFLLLALLRKLGVEAHDLGILRDDTEALRAAIGEAAAAHDLILTSGGVSTGEADHVRAAVEGLGRLVFWRLAIKPGRPVAMGVVNGTAFAGLPGNPVAVFVTFINVVRPLLTRLAGGIEEPLVPLPARATFSYRKKEGRREYVRVTLRPGNASEQVAVVEKYPVDGAGVLTSITRTTGLVALDEQCTRVEPGMIVDYLPYESLID